MKFYKYVGDGVGVAGLPHQVSDEEAERLGLLPLLEAAIQNGNYVPVDEPTKEPKKKEVKNDNRQ